jgi:hypothetical protein
VAEIDHTYESFATTFQPTKQERAAGLSMASPGYNSIVITCLQRGGGRAARHLVYGMMLCEPPNLAEI